MKNGYLEVIWAGGVKATECTIVAFTHIASCNPAISRVLLLSRNARHRSSTPATGTYLGHPVTLINVVLSYSSMPRQGCSRKSDQSDVGIVITPLPKNSLIVPNLSRLRCNASWNMSCLSADSSCAFLMALIVAFCVAHTGHSTLSSTWLRHL